MKCKLLIATCCPLLAGCAGSLDSYSLPPRAVKTVEPLDLEPATRPTTQPAADSLTLTLGDARSLALANNLDLEVDRLDIAVAGSDLNAEQATFEAFFEVDARYAKLDSPIVNQTVFPADGGGGEPAVLRVLGGQSDAISIDPAIVQPLRSGGQIRLSTPFDRITTDTGRVLNPQYEQDVRVSISQPLLRGFGSDATERGIRVAAARVGQARARQKLGVVQTLAAVDRAYWNLWAGRSAVDVRQMQLDLAQQQADRARRRFEAGDLPEVDAVRADSAAADARDLLVRAETQAERQSRQLKVLLNADLDSPLNVADPSRVEPASPPVPVAYDLDADRLADVALARRGDLLEAELRVAEARADELASRNAAFRPRLDVTYEIGINGLGGDYGDAVDTLGDGNFQDHVVGLRFEQPLGNRQRRAQQRSALLRRAVRLADVRQRELLVRQQVYDAVGSINDGYRRIETAAQRVTAARRLVDAETRRFDAGAASNAELLEAQTALASAELAYAEAVAGYEVARVDLAEATGTVLGKTGVVIE